MIRIEKYYYELLNGSESPTLRAGLGGREEHTWESAQEPTIMRLSLVMRTDVVCVQGVVAQVLLEAQQN